MSDSSSVNAESGITGVTTGGSSTAPSDVAGTNLPLLLMTAYQDDLQRNKVQRLTKLPSNRFRYTTWHELSSTQVKGNELRAPRVRDGPPEKQDMFYIIRDENNKPIHHTKRGRQKKDHRDKTENWENCEICNLSYQELGHGYQKTNFMRVLRRLIRVEELHLIDNSLVDLSSLSFPRCMHLNVSQNHLSSFKKLPKLPVVKELDLSLNDVDDFYGLEQLQKSQIERLHLKGNPISFTLNYRQRVFKAVPRLQVLDGIPKQPTDDVFESEEVPETKSCVIS